MAIAKKEYEVTVTCTGAIRVFADDNDQAMCIADRQDPSRILWDPTLSVTDAREVDDDENAASTETGVPIPVVIGAWHPGDRAWLLHDGRIVSGRVTQVSIRNGVCDNADLTDIVAPDADMPKDAILRRNAQILAAREGEVPNTIHVSCRRLFRTKEDLIDAVAAAKTET